MYYDVSLRSRWCSNYKDENGTGIRCVGFSLGIERIMIDMMKAASADGKGKVYRIIPNVMASIICKGAMKLRLELCAELCSRGIPTEFAYNENWNYGKQITNALNLGIPLMEVIGEK